jgi:hypothetical protein
VGFFVAYAKFCPSLQKLYYVIKLILQTSHTKKKYERHR